MTENQPLKKARKELKTEQKELIKQFAKLEREEDRYKKRLEESMK